MIAALYARVSTQRQEDEETIETQIFAIKEYVEKNGHKIFKEYKDDGWSGTILARPALDELRLDAKQKIWEAVIIYDPDRLARKYSYQSLVIDELEELGIEVLFVTTPPAKTDGDKLLYGVKGIFAEYERMRITDRFRLGKLRKAREGNIIVSRAPYGYEYVLKTKEKQGFYKIIETEATVVRQVFSWVGNDGYTIRQVVKKLNDLLIKPRKSLKGTWSTSTLSHLLRNETYIGRATFNQTYAVVPEKPMKNEKYKKIKKTSKRFKAKEEWISIPVPDIIGKDLFDKTRQQLQKNFELCQRNKKNEYLLSGHIYCTCGRRRAGEGPQRGKHLYYRCTDRVYRFPLPRECREKGVNARIADRLTWNGLYKFMSSPKLIKKQIDLWKASKQQPKNNDSSISIQKLKSELESMKREEQQYIKLYGMNLITLEQFEETTKDIKRKKGEADILINQLLTVGEKDDIILPDDETIESCSQKAVKVLKNLRFELKRFIIDQSVHQVIANQNQMKVRGYMPLRLDIENVKFKTINRDYRTSQCRKIYSF